MRRFLVVIALVVVSVIDHEGCGIRFVYADSAYNADGIGSQSKGRDCVEQIPVMRKKHMDFLYQQRDDAVYYGIRTNDYSLKGCVNCHMKKDDDGQRIPVNAADQFCQGCHQYAAVDIDCFQCHASISPP